MECHALKSGARPSGKRSHRRQKESLPLATHASGHIRRWVSAYIRPHASIVAVSYCIKLTCTCIGDSCQRTNHSIKAPHLQLQPVPITGLWNLWGVDLFGPLTLTHHGNRYIIVATDYFSKWPEAAPLRNK